MKRKLHALRPLPYETTVNWTLCQRHVERNQIAAFETGVTCKQCRAIIDFNIEWEAERAARRAKLYAEAIAGPQDAPAAGAATEGPDDAWPPSCRACGNILGLCTCERGI